MQSVRDKCRVATLVALTVFVGLVGLYSLIKPVSNGCIMTYMYPTYVPISMPESVLAGKYGLYLYHEGWKKIDFDEHLKKLNGVPVLFIPGNGGSYKQVRSLAAESDRAYQGGPLDRSHYQEASLTPEEGGLEMDGGLGGIQLPNQYSRRLDWFTVDLEGEHSAMDGRILEEHTEYVVYAIHRILDRYKESWDARAKEGAASVGSLPTSVILVGHSMGGFVARAAVVHPHLRMSAVETVLTLSSPHQSPPLALQPSLGHYFAWVNDEWRKGFQVQMTRTGHHVSAPALSHVVAVSITGGANDYQVRTKLESLEGIVPPRHGLTISTTGMKNVWLSMEHQAILWCNQVVVQVSHTLLSLVDSKTGQTYPDTQKRLAIFAKMLRSGVAQSFNWMNQSHSLQHSTHSLVDDERGLLAGSQVHSFPTCPSNINWSNDGLERDLYIETTTVTVLAMDGRRRWLDIQKLGSDGRNHFILVTNLAPCSGVRLHLWPEKGKLASEPADRRVREVTSKMVHIPSGPTPTQIEPGSQTEQPPPSAVFLLSPEDMLGFRFLTISVAPRPSVSGRPPPAASMAVGQFFDPGEGEREFSRLAMLSSMYSEKDIFFKEDHPLAFNLSFGISLGLLPVTLSLKTAGCGIKKSGLPLEEAGDVEHNRLCKLRCFPPVALAWDTNSGLHVIPNLFTETIVVDSSPGLLSSTPVSDRTTVLLLVDPHCAYKSSISASFTAAASRFMLLYGPKTTALSIAVIFFALMRQAWFWDRDLPIPPILTAVQLNLRMPSPFLPLVVVPILVSLLLSLLMDQSLPPLASFTVISLICYLLGNGLMIIVIWSSQLVFSVAAIVHVFISTRWQVWELNRHVLMFHWFLNLSSGFFLLKMVRLVRANLRILVALVASSLVCFVHPALGLFILLSSDALCCHFALCSHVRRREITEFNREANGGFRQSKFDSCGNFNGDPQLEENYSSSPESTQSFVDTQLEIFHHQHSLLILHFLTMLMFVPSLLAWWQRIGTGQSFPWLIDSVLCIGVILHGICNQKPDSNSFLFSFPGIGSKVVQMYYMYQVAGYYCFLAGLTLAPYKIFYPSAAIGFLSFLLSMLQKRSRDKGAHVVKRKHSHRH
ncbi:uncharacterized protein LOC116213832 isoform X2 [Punica granatum]|uniref:GPI inositol-deacylase n=1 Tax=Punica granatum TaxID=22663 RepID=A0A6P8ECN0_PUNGR|nr:uncharacterized protein LOC116213832 isoform X2 [Punica granatum]